MEMSQPSNKNQRNKRIETFSEALDKIKKFAVREDSDDWKRCLVCGICWLPEGIAINTHQLRILIFKCKSSINGSLQKMGFNVNLGRTDAANAMVNSIPFLKDNTPELRQWTVRKKSDGEEEKKKKIENNENGDEKQQNLFAQNEAENDFTSLYIQDSEVVSPPPTDLFDMQSSMFVELARDQLDLSLNNTKIDEGKDDLADNDFWNSSIFLNGNSWGCF